jgi:hypothetical protein
MDEMNQFEKQLQSWTPRRPSPKIARRLFGPAHTPASRSHRAHTWSWLTPLAACALTLLVAVHSGSGPSAQLASRNDGAFFATFMLDAAGSSNPATYSLSQIDENLEWNVWSLHATHHVTEIAPAEPRARMDVWNLIPTNR